MPREPALAATPAAARGARLSARVLVALSCAAAALGLLAAARPDAFHLQTLSLAGTAALGLALLLFAATLRWPSVGLCGLVVFVYLNLSEVLVRHHGLPSLLQLLFVPLSVAAWVGGDRRHLGRAARHPLTLLLAAYSLVLLGSSVVARDPGASEARFLESGKALALFFLVLALADSASRLRQATWAMLGAGALLAGLGLVQVASGDFRQEFGGLARIKQAQIWGELFEPRIAGPLGDPNFFAQILLVLVPLALALGWTEPRRPARLAAFGAAFLLASATVLTYSRGGALALAGALVLSLLAAGVRGRRALAAAGLGAALLLALPSDFTRRLTTLGQILPGGEAALDPDSSFEKRRLMTRVAWRIFRDHPLAGVGAGNYTVHFDAYAADVGSAAREYEEPFGPFYPHSLYLEIAAETGVLGLAAFAAVVLACLASLERAHRRFFARREVRLASLCRGLEIAVLAYLVSSLFLHGHFLRYLWLLFGLAAALNVVASRAASEEACAPARGEGG